MKVLEAIKSVLWPAEKVTTIETPKGTKHIAEYREGFGYKDICGLVHSLKPKNKTGKQFAWYDNKYLAPVKIKENENLSQVSCGRCLQIIGHKESTNRYTKEVKTKTNKVLNNKSSDGFVSLNYNSSYKAIRLSAQIAIPIKKKGIRYLNYEIDKETLTFYPYNSPKGLAVGLRHKDQHIRLYSTQLIDKLAKKTGDTGLTRYPAFSIDSGAAIMVDIRSPL